MLTSGTLMNPKHPVYIISKGRWDSRHTSKALDKMNMPYSIVVEDHEYEQYARVINEDKILILPEKYIKNYDACTTDQGKSNGPGAARNFCWENSYDQEVYQEGINKYVDAYVGQQPDMEAEKTKLGENAEARLDAVNSWASTFFSPEQYEVVSQTMGSNVDGIEALEKIMESQKQNISRSAQVAQPERALSVDDVKTMMKDPKYFDPRHRDASYVKRVDDMWARLNATGQI